MAIYLTLTVVVIATALLIKQTDECANAPRLIYRGMTRQQAVNIIGMLIIFTALVTISSLRVNVGNDYAKYVEFMHLVYCKAYVPTEVGFNILTYAVYTLCGFENYMLVFAIFAFATVLFFLIGMWQQSEWFTLSFAFFMLLGYYFQSISTVRYYLALGMALFSIKYVIKKDWPRFLLVILLGALFHKSILVVLVLYPIAQIRWRRWMYGAMAVLGVSCLFLQDQYLKIVVFLYPSYENTEYLSGGTSAAGILRCVAVLAFSLLLYKDVVAPNRTYRFYFICNLMSLVLYVFGSFLPIISRIGYYMTVTHILFVPALILKIKDDRKRKIVMVLTILVAVMYFALYMRGAANDGIRILPYETILYHEMPLTLSERGY